MSTKAIPYVLKKDFLSIVLAGKPFSLNSTHPTFSKLKKALKDKNWTKVPKLVSVAEDISTLSRGLIKVSGGKVFYKDREIHSSLSKRMVEMVKQEKPIKHMVKFMENLYQNPLTDSQDDLFKWLENCNLPITDDGCFVAYKSVDKNYNDEYTHKIDNSVGQQIMMPFSAVDKNKRNNCSFGFHVCSRTYLPVFHRDGHIMKVKVNPKYVARVPDDANFAKMGISQYEVIGEVPENEIKKVLDITDIDEFNTSLYPIRKKRQELLAEILKDASIKRSIKKKKTSKSSLMKASFSRLLKIAEKLGKCLPKSDKIEKFPLRAARLAAGFTVGQVAKKMGKSYKATASIELSTTTTQDNTDAYLEAIANLSGITNIKTSAITFPVAVVN